MINRLIKSLSGILCLLIAVNAHATEKLNVLFIPIDDLKPMLGCYGDETIQTPNMDRLAERGTVFLNNSCQQAICGPSRVSIMSGLYPDQTGVYNMRQEDKMRKLNPDILTLPQYFRRQGYQTTGVGKTFDPRNMDSDHDKPSWSIPYESIPPVRSMPYYRDYIHPETLEAAKKVEAQLKGQVFNPSWKKDVKIAEIGGPMVRPATEAMDVPDDAYRDGAVANAAIKTLDLLAEKNQPFFLSVGFYKPHLPFVAPQKYWDLYDRDKIEVAEFQDFPRNSHWLGQKRQGGFGEMGMFSDVPQKEDFPEEVQKRLIHGYMATVSYVDAQIGKVLDHLDHLGLTEKTIICLWGDHGFHLGDHGIWTKHTNYEQAVRSPLILVSPAGFGANQTQSPSEFVDVFPTLCELTGLDIPSHLPGKSLVPLMRKPSASVRFAALSQYPRQDKYMGYSLRNERFRYTKWLEMDFRNGEHRGTVVATELYDYENDPLETVNLAGDPAFAGVVETFEVNFRKRGVAQEQ